MAKHVRSDDPRKPAIVAALKAKTGGTKVTCLEELPGGSFRGICMWGRLEQRVDATVTPDEVAGRG